MFQRNPINDMISVTIFDTITLLNNTIDGKSDLIITDQDGRTLNSLNIETNDDGKMGLKLHFKSSNKSCTDDFDFEEMRKERKRYIENLANDSYENICNIIRTSNKNGKNVATYIFDNDKYDDTIIDTIIKKLSSKGFNVRKNDEGVLHKTYARIIIAWS